MARVIILLCCALIAVVVVALPQPDASMEASFAEWKARASRTYSTPDVEAERFAAFQLNMKAVADARRENPLATFDLSVDTFDALPSRAQPPRLHPLTAAVRASARVATTAASQLDRSIERMAYPAKLDWRTRGAVGPVHCSIKCDGANVAFSLMGNIEGTFYVQNQLPNNGTLVRGSTEQLVDCASKFGCAFGAMYSDYYTWILKDNNGEVATEASYPYRNGHHTCRRGPFPPAAKITAFKALPSRNETSLTQYVARLGPIATGVYFAGPLQYYTGGIVTTCGRKGKPVDLEALIVGYDDTHSPPYWILKNTFSTAWGENGYFRVKKHGNVCGVANIPTTAIPATQV